MLTSADQVHGLDPLVHRAVIAASAVPDLQGRYDVSFFFPSLIY